MASLLCSDEIFYLLRACQGYRLLRTGANTEAASFASLGINEQRLLPAMNKPLDLALDAEAGAQRCRQTTDREHPHGADAQTLALAFASVAIDDRRINAGNLLTFWGMGQLRWILRERADGHAHATAFTFFCVEKVHAIHRKEPKLYSLIPSSLQRVVRRP